jgi:hypothetical protein
MQLISMIAVLFAMSNIILMIMYLVKKPRCPPCPEQEPCEIDNIGIKSVRIIPELDIQFSERNLPSKVYQDVFTGPNVWIGGYSSGMNSGRGIKQKNKKD